MPKRLNPTRAAALQVALSNDPPPGDSLPVVWWRLITEADLLRARSGRGLANVWEAIHKGDHHEARRLIDEEQARQ